MRYPFNIPKVITRTFANHVATTGMATAGVDYGNMPDGTPLYAIEDGSIANWTDNSAGGDIGLDLYGSDGRTWKYNHLSSHVGGNRAVKEGDLIAYSGHSGYATGPHLCLACIIGGVRQDAEIILNGANQEEMINAGDLVEFSADSNLYQGSGFQYPNTGLIKKGAVAKIKDGPRQADGKVWYDCQFNDNSGWTVSDTMLKTTRETTPVNAYVEPTVQKSDYDALVASTTQEIEQLKNDMASMQAMYEKQITDLTKAYEQEIASLEARIAVLEAGITPQPPIQVTTDITVFSINQLTIALINKIVLWITKR